MNDLDQTFEDTWKTRSDRLGGLSYAKYLESQEWREVRAKAAKRPHYQACWHFGSTEGLEIHHRSYKWIGTKHAMRGLVALCRECHQRTHDYAKGNRISVRKATNLLKKEKATLEGQGTQLGLGI